MKYTVYIFNDTNMIDSNPTESRSDANYFCLHVHTLNSHLR